MPESAPKTLTVAIVDDDPDMLAFMEALLSAAGHRVTTYLAALYAISEIVRSRPNVVLVDLRMSQIDGFELLKELRAREELARSKLIAVSAMSPTYWREKAEAAGAQGFIEKPLNPETFVGLVEATAYG